jgi:putative transposase
MSLSRSERQGLIEPDKAEIPLYMQCELLGLNRSTLYYVPKQAFDEEISIKHRIDEIYTEFPYYGSRRIQAQLQREQLAIGRDLVRRYMREMSICAIYPTKNLSKRNLQHKVYPYLLKGLEIKQPNNVWGIDITYIRLRKGWLYLVAIIDWYSRFVVSWELDQTLEMHFVLEDVNRALKNFKPDIMNSDQGSHFTSTKYTRVLEGQGIQISMDGKGRAIDNVITERLFRSLKYEEVYINSYEMPRDARIGINGYFDKYNYRRLHQSLGYKTPAEIYFG